MYIYIYEHYPLARLRSRGAHPSEGRLPDQPPSIRPRRPAEAPRKSEFIYIYIYIYEHSSDLRQASGSATQHPPEAPYRAAKKEKVLVHVIYIYI